MQKFIINSNILGYNVITLENGIGDEVTDAIIVVNLDSSLDDKVSDLYKIVHKALINRNKVILVSVNDQNKLFKPIASLMLLYNNYNIYCVDNKDDISAKYLLELETREPDISEVQTFIGGDLTAYSDITTILFGIESITDEGDLDKLKTFVENHLNSIENLTYTINSMKKTCDSFNSNTLIEELKKAKETADELNKQLDDKTCEVNKLKDSIENASKESENLKIENKKLESANKELESQINNSNGSIIKSYKELNVQLLQCKTKIILYFKEVSYVKYTNTLVYQIFNYLKTARKLKIKLLIYDSQTSLYSTYNNLQKVSGSDYVAMKNTLIQQTGVFVVSEPIEAILSDVLQSTQCFDVVIVYDRMKCKEDIVTGNNVTKFYVINSNNDYEAVKNQLKISDVTSIITNKESRIGTIGNKPRQFLDIPYIENYTGQTDSAKTSKYLRVLTEAKQVSLITTILDKSKISTLYS